MKWEKPVCRICGKQIKEPRDAIIASTYVPSFWLLFYRIPHLMGHPYLHLSCSRGTVVKVLNPTIALFGTLKKNGMQKTDRAEMQEVFGKVAYSRAIATAGFGMILIMVSIYVLEGKLSGLEWLFLGALVAMLFAYGIGEAMLYRKLLSEHERLLKRQ